MHMNSAPHLLSEDRKEYERILDEALRSAPHRPDLTAVGRRFSPEQLRAMALGATALITAAAAAEYQHYVKVREDLRTPAGTTTGPVLGSDAAEAAGGEAIGLVTTAEGTVEPEGAGIVAVLAVLAPVLAGTAAAIFLLVGYVLKMVDPEPQFARTMLTTGWVFGAITAAAILVAAVGLLLTALRNGSTALPAEVAGERDEQVEHAREAWRLALLERGLLPFLRETLADPGTAVADRADPSQPGGRIPHLGYHRPGFSSPDDGSTGPRPSFSSPDFSSPDFGGPEHRPD
ncbi:hypothetical protein ACWCP6_08795 [Streptomyces sp. NPDC002004]